MVCQQDYSTESSLLRRIKSTVQSKVYGTDSSLGTPERSLVCTKGRDAYAGQNLGQKECSKSKEEVHLK